MPAGPRVKQQASRWALLKSKPILAVAAVAALAIAVAIAAVLGGPDRTEKQAYQKSWDALYNEALEDGKNDRLLDSISKLNQLKSIDPDSERAAKALASTVAKALAEAEKKIADGNQAEAREILDRLKAVDPGNKAIDRALKKIDPKPAKSPGKQPKAETPPDSSDPDPPAPPLSGKLSDPNALPINIVPSAIDGYNFKHNWDDYALAGAAYTPAGAAMSREVEGVLLTIGKLEVSGSLERLAEEKGLFPDDGGTVKVNGFAGYSGRGPGGTVVLTWTQEQWFFAIHVIPNQAQSVDFLKGVAVDVSGKLGL
jgi:tetratricopeptide (TPR) repeat protein